MGFTIEKIFYKRREVDRGVILGSVEFKSDLVRTKNPLQCEDLTDNTRIDCISPHKKNIVVYVPPFYLSPGLKIRILTGTNGVCQYQTFLINEVSEYHVDSTLLNTEHKTFTPRTVKPLDLSQYESSTPFETENPFLDGAECSGPVSATIPDVLKVGSSQFRKKTNFIFMYTENQERLGSKFEKVPPSRILEIYGDTVLVSFPSGAAEYDILTGRRVFNSRRLYEERRNIINQGGKIAPSFQRIQ